VSLVRGTITVFARGIGARRTTSNGVGAGRDSQQNAIASSTTVRLDAPAQSMRSMVNPLRGGLRHISVLLETESLSGCRNA
jgi:hypothetical protein